MGSGKDADRNMPGKPGSAICATDSEPNPLGDVPSAPSHRNRGAAREEIYWKPFRPNAIPLGRRDYDTVSSKRGPRAVRPLRTGNTGPQATPADDLPKRRPPLRSPKQLQQGPTMDENSGFHLTAIDSCGVAQLKPLYEALAQHHNDVSAHAVRRLPTGPIDMQLAECRDDLAAGKTQVVVIKCRVRRKGRGILHNRYRARSGIHRRAVRASRLARQRPRYPAALVAIAPFDATGVDGLELMVVEGNEGAMLLCERFCFLPVPRIMRRWPYGQK